MTLNWTAEDIPDLTGKVAIVTGANRGIGYATARALACKGAAVILACRNKVKGEAAAWQIVQEYPEAKVELLCLDLSDLALVRRFGDEFASRHDRLDILINNAAIMFVPFGKTVDGYELQFATNHLAHFALTGLLLDHIVRTPLARVVTASSWGHIFGVIDLGNLNAEKGYDPGGAYAHSKLANILFTYELQRRFEGAGVEATAHATHPGWTATDLPAGWTATTRQLDWRIMQTLNPLIGQSPEMGALPTLYAATAPDVQGGDYYGPADWGGLRGCPTKTRYSERSYDTAVAAKLWAASEVLTGVWYSWSVEKGE